MHPHSMALIWCEETWGERPVRISDWANHDDIVQVLIRLSSSVLIADFLWTLWEIEHPAAPSHPARNMESAPSKGRAPARENAIQHRQSIYLE